MSAVETSSDLMREKTIEAAKRYRASWIELGQHLYAIYKDKHFKSWGFLSFEAYCVSELGLKQTAAAKLLKSYFFLEKEEPRVVSAKFAEEESPKAVPNYESVNLLRLAKENKTLTAQDYAELRETVIEKTKEPKDVRAQLKEIVEKRKPKATPEEHNQRRIASVKRVISLLNNARQQLQDEDLLPDYLSKQLDELIEKLLDQVD